MAESTVENQMNEEKNFRPVAHVRPPAPYIGGKRLLAKRLAERISEVPHATYCEGFIGMGGVFFRRQLAPPAEVINDLSGDVANLFRILQRHYPQLMDVLKFQVTSRHEFERLKASRPETLTDLERAARFLYLQRLAFGGKVRGRNFGVSAGISARFDLNKLGPMLADIHERLAGVVIENLPWEAFLNRYDRPDTLFYLDPPYWGSEDDYGVEMFPQSSFAALAGTLRHLRGRFLLSINDVPEVRALFGGFALEEVGVTYSIQGGAGHQARELIISQ